MEQQPQQQQAPEIGRRQQEGGARAAGDLDGAARDEEPPEQQQQQPQPEEQLQEDIVGAAPAPLPPRLAGAAAVAVAVEVEVAVAGAGEHPLQVVHDSNDIDIDRIELTPRAAAGAAAGAAVGAAAALLRSSSGSRRRARQAADPPEPAAGERDGRREVCPPRVHGAAVSSGTGSRRQNRLSLWRRVGRTTATTTTGGGGSGVDGVGEGAGVALLSSLCLEAMVATWESHSSSAFLPRAYHMPHELCARLLRLLVASKKLTASSLSGDVMKLKLGVVFFSIC